MECKYPIFASLILCHGLTSIKKSGIARAITGGQLPLPLPSECPSSFSHEMREIYHILSGLNQNQGKEILKKANSLGMSTLFFGDDQYPELLSEIPDPPVLLFYKGNISALSMSLIGIVGARGATLYGKNVARMLANDLAMRGVAVISGLARGIDTIAHRSCLDAGGITVGVMGCGLNVSYPPDNSDLVEDILKGGGLIISEFPPSTPPLPANFPVRNRIISGLSLGIVVVEASGKSGSLITARLALEQGREVFAVPHNITSRTGEGPNTLITKGARLVQRADDILEELRINFNEPLTKKGNREYNIPLSELENKILEFMRYDDGTAIDMIISSLKCPLQDIMQALLTLKMKGLVVEVSGGRYGRILKGGGIK